VANTILTPTMITREAARILHQQGTFLSNVNRQYDDKFAVSGAKIGTSLNLRLPSKYTVRTNATFAGQDHTERSVPFNLSSQYGVDVSFTTADRTMSLDDFSKRVLAPAMKQLAAKIEADALALAYKSVNQYVNATTNAKLTYAYLQRAGALMTNVLTPVGDRTAILNPLSSVEFLDATKGLFAAQSNLNEQFREGMMGRTGGFDIGENTLLPVHTTGSLAGTPLTDGAALGTSTTTANTWVSQTVLEIDGATSTTTLKAGDIITLSGVYAVHPESKANTGALQKFVVQSDVTFTTSADNYSVTVKPGMIYGSGNAFQNCALSGVANSDGLTVTLIGAVSTAFAQDLFFHKDAFVFGTADLEDVSKYGAECSRANTDGISLRWTQQYAIASDTVAGRFDILWGFAPLYPELAVRHLTTQSILV
jgi:hypothetical protein